MHNLLFLKAHSVNFSAASQQSRLFLLSILLLLCIAPSALAQKETATKVKDLDTQKLRSFLQQRSDIVIIDVRLPSELITHGGTIDGGFRNYNLSRGWLELRMDEFVPDKNTPIVVICGIAARSPLAAKTISNLGYSEVYNYADGFFKWRDAGLPVKLTDENPGSMLFSKPVKVDEGIWSAIGATAPPTSENSGHNNNLSFIVTDEGVVVVNAGANALLAQALHSEIKKVTDKPIKYVILENGQGHAMLGSDYWQRQGAKIIAHADAAEEIAQHGVSELERMRRIQRDKAMGTVLTKPDIIFDEKHSLTIGGEVIEILNLGPAHSPGDIVVWLPKRKLVIAGDMAFHQRILPVFEHTDTQAWLETWPKFVALGAEKVIPGHGGPTTMVEVQKYTHDYLKFLREAIAQLIEEGGGLDEAYNIDQTPFAHLDTFDELAKKNAGRIFQAMEFE